MMDWTGLVPDPDKYDAFVYRITNNVNGYDYIGMKYYKHKKSLPPLKGRTNKRIRHKESDWLEYYGSSKPLLGVIEDLGKEAFSREIIYQGTRGECQYMEAYYQFTEGVLLRENNYNGQIRVHTSAGAVKNIRVTESKV